MKGGQAIANILEKEGVEYLFCFPNNPVIDPAAEIGIRPIMARTERTAVAMADGYTRISNGRRIGVVGMQQGPGVENAFPGVAQAYSDASPILVLPGMDNRPRLYQEPNFDAVLNYREITKWAARIDSVERVPELMRRAFTYLRMGRPGPVLLEVPWDVAKTEIDADAARYEPVKATRTAADTTDVATAVRALLAANNPLIHAGHGVLYAEAWDELREFAELVGAPVMTTMPGKSAFPENHPLSVGAGGLASAGAVPHFLRKADVIFAVGASLTKTPYGAPIPEGKVIIQATVDELDINKEYPVDHPLMGDARLILQQCIAEVKRQTGPQGPTTDAAVTDEIRQVKDDWWARWMPKLTSDETPINPYRVIWELMNTLDPAEVIITGDSGTPRDMLVPFWKSVSPRGYIGWGKSTHLGYSLGLAMGAKLAAPDKLVINYMGDAAFGMTGMDVETAVRNKIPILTIVLNNSCLGNYQQHIPIASERYRLIYFGGNYAPVAEGLGAYAERVEQAADITPAIRRAHEALAGGRPALLEMITREETELSPRF